MAFTHVQGIAAHGTISGSNTATLTFAATVGSGNWVGGGGVAVSDGIIVSSVTDDKGNTYTVKDSLDDAGDSVHWFDFELGNITNAPITITVTFGSGSGNTFVLIADEYSGASAVADPTDGHAIVQRNAPGTGTDAITSTSITTTVNGDLIYSICFDTASTPAPTAGTGFNSQTSDTGGQNAVRSEDKTQSTAGSVNATFTSANGGDNFGVIIIAVKPKAGGDGVNINKQNFTVDKFKTAQRILGPKAGTFPVRAFPSVAVAAAPFRQTDWLLPQAVEPYAYRSFEWNNRKLLTGQDVLPFRQRDWPLSVNPEPDPRRSWTLSLLQTTLTPVVVQPFRQTDWPLPQAVEPDPRRSWTWSYNLNLIGQDRLPFRQMDWPPPERGVEPDARRSWTWSRNLNLIGQDALPFRQFDWSLPQSVEPDPRRSWTLSLLQTTLTPVIVIPFRQTDWPLPVAVEPNPQRSWASSYILSLIGQDVLPFRQMDWPNPLPASPWQMAPVLPNLTLILPPFIPPVSQPFQQITSLGGILNPGANAIG